MPDKTKAYIKMDEKNHVEEPFLHQLETMPGLHWKVLHLDNYQSPEETQRRDFMQVIPIWQMRLEKSIHG